MNSNPVLPFERPTRADQMWERFVLYHQDNPAVWQAFVRFADEARSRRARYSADAILHRIRWHLAIETRGEDVKINDHYSALYSRMYSIYRDCPDFFEKRRRLSESRDAYDIDMPVYSTGPAGSEARLMRKIEELLDAS